MSKPHTLPSHQATKLSQAMREFAFEQLPVTDTLDQILQRVATTVTPVWPLKDYVAVNPYAGISERGFLEARSFLRAFSDCETLMPLAYYAQQFHQGHFGWEEIHAAAKEIESAGFDVLSSAAICEILEAHSDSPRNEDATDRPLSDRLRTVTEYVDEMSDIHWTDIVLDEISKHCSAHYDQSQASWKSPWSHLPLYQAWLQAAAHDRNVETLGLRDFRKLVAELPHSPEAAIVHLLGRLGVPQPMWEKVLLCQVFAMPGWSAWARYQTENAAQDGMLRNDFAGLIAMRLAYDVAVGELFSFSVDWDSWLVGSSSSAGVTTHSEAEEVMLRYTLLRASEIGYRNSLLSSLALPTRAPMGQTPWRTMPTDENGVDVEAEGSNRLLAQMVFCIDVRSERLRRNLEAQASEVETYGFAGFFALPIAYSRLGEQVSDSHVPVLLKPQFQLHEGFHNGDEPSELTASQNRAQIRKWRRLWKQLQSSAVGCFTFVETAGLLYGLKLLQRASGIGKPTADPHFDGVQRQERPKLGPTLRGLNRQGITTSRQVDLVEGMLRNIGITSDFARLVVFCGHASQTDNNPLGASLDCGACGGHSGEPNARLAALLLNQEYIRQGLVERGITIPADTHFLAGLHNTTTDAIEYFDLDDVPSSHVEDVQQLRIYSTSASQLTATERLRTVASPSLSDLLRRSSDWSEVRPEWGLAGNAAFIAAPRSLTRDVDLDGRAFLHSYNHLSDPKGSVLETIMTAPMIVANWINMQYFASTVDARHFGSGNKTVHNVVGGFGILSGGSGDLMTGLPWQSLHDGERFQHAPLRLQAVIAAPRSAIQRVIEKHAMVANLLSGGWMHLVALEEDGAYHYAADGGWQAVGTLSPSPACAIQSIQLDAPASDILQRQYSKSEQHDVPVY